METRLQSNRLIEYILLQNQWCVNMLAVDKRVMHNLH